VLADQSPAHRFLHQLKVVLLDVVSELVHLMLWVTVLDHHFFQIEISYVQHPLRQGRWAHSDLVLLINFGLLSL